MSLALGIAINDITPPPGLPMGGYAARTEAARSTLDPLACRVAVLRSHDAAVALIALDLLYVRAPWATATRRRVARRLGTDAAAVMIAATHTHAGPAVFRVAMRETDELIEYEHDLADIIDVTVAQAVARTESVTLHHGAARSRGVAANRQEEGRGFDDCVRALVARSGDGRVAGVIAAFGCHPTVLPPENLAYSRDLFGAAIDLAEQTLAAPVLLFNGAAADVSTRFTRRGQTYEEVTRLGRGLAEAVLATVRDARPIDDAPLAGRVIEVALELRQVPSVDAAQSRLNAAAAALQEARGCVSDAELRRLTAHVEGAAAQLYFSQRGGIEALLGAAPECATVQLLRVGGCDILGAPGELFSEMGRDICARRARPVLLIGYANDYVGYLVPPGHSGGYETLISLITESSAAAIAEALSATASEER